MKKNVKCTIEDIINLLKEKYLQEGEQSLYADNDWHVYEAADGDWLLTTVCCVTAPPAFDEETGDEIIPEFAAANDMNGSVLAEIFQDVMTHALQQKRDATNEELLKALNYYMTKDSFLTL